MLRSIVFLPMEGEFQVSEPKSTQSVWGKLIIRNARQTVQRNSIAQTGKIASRRHNRHLRASVRHTSGVVIDSRNHVLRGTTSTTRVPPRSPAPPADGAWGDTSYVGIKPATSVVGQSFGNHRYPQFLQHPATDHLLPPYRTPRFRHATFPVGYPPDPLPDADRPLAE